MVRINKDGWFNIFLDEGKVEPITGKYLFFSDNKEELINLAETIMLQFNLNRSKVPESNIPNKTRGFGFPLCIYDTSNKLKHVLKKFETQTIKYRYFKLDSDTLAGKYSKNYKNGQ